MHWSIISPVDLFGVADDVDSVDLSQTDVCQPRWNELGEYDFGYQPGNRLDVRSDARRPQLTVLDSKMGASNDLRQAGHDPCGA